MAFKILIVDDSVYVRRALKTMIDECLDGVEYLYAETGTNALPIALQERPNLIILDLEMPQMDGFTFLRLVMAQRPIPIIVVSSKDDRESVMKALQLGALEFISKPTESTSTRIYEIQADIKQKIKTVLKARFGEREQRPMEPVGQDFQAVKDHPKILIQPNRIICVGASTGGPGVISQLLSKTRLPADTSIVVAQHMPAGFTEAFAQRLDKILTKPVDEIRHLDRIEAGRVYICPGGYNTVISRKRDLRFALVGQDEQTPFLPSVDRLFTSAAEVFGSQVLGVVMTGMGNDGLNGAKDIKAMGGQIFCEDPNTAIIPGMPRATIDADLADIVCNNNALPGAIEQWLLKILQPK